MTSHEKWSSILNWERKIELGKIHNLSSDKFEANYYETPSIEKNIKSLVRDLNRGEYRLDKLIIGKPGCGKTTFIYYLNEIKFKEYKSINEKYHFAIIHFLRFIRKKKKAPSISIEAWMKDLFVNYLEECGYKIEVAAILRNKDFPDNNAKINALLNFLKKEQKQNTCTKKLIICIDDIDEAPMDQVEPILRCLYSYMETAAIEKWITVRGITLDHYPLNLSNFIQTKFPHRISFPMESFNGILAKRISDIGENPKNPFGMQTCNDLITVFDEDLEEL